MGSPETYSTPRPADVHSPVIDEAQAADPALDAEVKAAAESETAEAEAQTNGDQAE